jgi:hypothetical protein
MLMKPDDGSRERARRNNNGPSEKENERYLCIDTHIASLSGQTNYFAAMKFFSNLLG